jgi:hypothetical protein
MLFPDADSNRSAWTLISDARGITVPDTDAQRDFILGLQQGRGSECP